MNPYEALIVVILIIVVIYKVVRWLDTLPVSRTCRCGRRYCTGCGREG